MLSLKAKAYFAEQVQLHFQSSDARLIGAALELARNGWGWEEIRPLLSAVHSVGYDRGQYDATGGY